MWETLVYFDLFDYPLTRPELIKFCHKKGLSFTHVKESPYRNFYFLPGRESLVALRRQRLYFSQLKWQLLHRLQWRFKLIPWIKLVAITGALSMNNALEDDDIDLMIITKENRLWLTRLLLLILFFPWLRHGRNFLQGPTLKVKSEKRSDLIGITNKLCLNLWLDDSALKLEQKNLFVAHELAQLKPIINKDETYQKLINANLWIKKYLPNWDIKGRSLTGDPAEIIQGRTLKVQSVKRSDLIGFLDFLSFRLQYLYMKSKITRERIERHFAFFHPRPTGEIILKQYRERLKGLSLPQGQTLKVKSEKRSDLIGIKILVTGCFDILHSEHKKFLKAAKNLGGQLVVGLETDARVRKLKGPGRPVNPFEIRLKNLRQLGIADEVFALPKQFNDLNHFSNLINQIKPDILAVSESTPFLYNKRQLMAQYDGKVVMVLRHNPNVSTTLLTKRLRNSKI